MGNTGSSGVGGGAGGGGASAPTPTAKKICYYELLSTERSATQDEIKKAYKRKALELHPDRNYNDVERATRLFAEVQAAYEVLSDPQERAWYDSHREAILHERDPHSAGGGGGGGGGSNEGRGGGHRYTSSTTSEEILSWFTLFPSKSKIDYTDSPFGFFTILSRTFAKLAEEERTAASEQGLDDEPWYPSFGGSKSGYDDHVKEFYQHWTSFKTIKDFSWYDLYRLSDAPDRRMRRAMEKENERLRYAAKREYEDNIREFVQFVRKRDPRYTPHIPKSDAERRAEQLAKSKEQAARARAANAAAQRDYKPADWTQVAVEDEELYEDEYSEFDEGEEEEEQEKLVWECVACKKTFKAEGQFTAHEKSKKHKQAVWQLKKKMEKENKELGLSTQESEDEVDGDEDDDVDEVVVEEKKGDMNGKKLPSETTKQNQDKTANEEKDAASPPPTLRDRTTPQKPIPTNADDDSGGNALDEDKGEDDNSEEDSDHIPTSKFHARIFGSSTSMPGDTSTNDIADSLAGTSLNPSDTEQDSNKKPSASKNKTAKAKREKKKAAAAAAVAAGGAGGAEGANEQTCHSCNQRFSSKTKMFTHLREFPDHIAPPLPGKGKVASSGGGGGGKKGKGKKK